MLFLPTSPWGRLWRSPHDWNSPYRMRSKIDALRSWSRTWACKSAQIRKLEPQKRNSFQEENEKELLLEWSWLQIRQWLFSMSQPLASTLSQLCALHAFYEIWLENRAKLSLVQFISLRRKLLAFLTAWLFLRTDMSCFRVQHRWVDPTSAWLKRQGKLDLEIRAIFSCVNSRSTIQSKKQMRKKLKNGLISMKKHRQAKLNKKCNNSKLKLT